MEVPPVIIQAMDDPDLVLKPMVTWGFPLFSETSMHRTRYKPTGVFTQEKHPTSRQNVGMWANVGPQNSDFTHQNGI